ncbi:MAG: FAD-binding oxidoreductase [Ktedonobacterales bacterium]
MAGSTEGDGEARAVTPPQEAREHLPAAVLIERLQRVLDAEGVLSDVACQAYAVRGFVPLAVAKPADVEGVSAALAVASELGAAVVPWGGGSRMAIGLPPRRCDLVLSLERLRAMLAYDPADLTVSVQAGATHGELARRLASSGQMLPLDVPLPERATLGGTLATATAGLRRAFYGSPRDLVLGLRVVDARGTVLKTGGRVVKNVTGYDMSKLYIGALGTLGVIVEVNLKLTPLPEAEGTVLGVFGEAGDAFAAVEPLDAMGVRPSALTVVQVGAVPELASVAPDHLESALLAARFPGAPSAVARAMREGGVALTQAGARMTLPVEGEAQTTFWTALDNFTQYATGSDDALVHISAQPSECATLLDVALNSIKGNGGVATWLADATTGTIWLRIHADENERADRTAALGDVLMPLYEALRECGGAPAVLAAPAEAAARGALWGVSGATGGLMRDIKQRFDPDGLLNPGRFVVG